MREKVRLPRVASLTRRSVLHGLTALAGTAWVAAPMLGKARAQSAWPDRPIRFIVPFAAGGPTDVAARLLVGPLQDVLGTTIVIENRGGAAGSVGYSAVARAAPDGYTALFTGSSFLVNPGLFKSLPYDPLTDFAPVAELLTSPNMIAAHPSTGLKTIADLVAFANANPGKLNYASAGLGSTPHLSAELLKLRAGINIVPVLFPGGGPAVQAVLAGTTELSATALPPTQQHIQAGSLNGLVTTGSERWPDLPAIPTMAEAGYPDFVHETIQALLVPSGTPKPIIERLAAESINVMQRLEIKERARQLGYVVLAKGPEALATRMAKEIPAWKDIIKRAGIPVN